METVVDSNKVRIVLTEITGFGACVDLYAHGAGGWAQVLGSDRDTAALHERTRARGPVLYTRNREIVFTQKLVSASIKSGVATVVLAGKADGHTAEQKLTLRDGDSHVNVVTTVTLGKSVRVAALGTAYVFLPGGKLYSQYEPLDFCWIPQLRREKEHVIGDQIFRSPAVIFQTGGIAASIVPDLDVLAERRVIPTVLDARIENPELDAPAFSYGFCNYEVDGHVYFKSKPPRREPLKGELVYGYDLIVCAAAPERHAHRRVAEHIWRRYGEPLIAGVEPQALDFDEYARRAYGFAFDRGGIWREFDYGGERVGGTITTTFAGPARTVFMKSAQLKNMLRMQDLIPRIHGIGTEKILNKAWANDIAEQFIHRTNMTAPPQIMNQAWMCNMRTAYGAFAYARRWNDDEMKTKALKMKEFALSAPVEHGFMSAICFCPEDGEPFWMQGTKAFQAVREYHLPDNAWTGWWMLRWYEELEKDERLLERAKTLGAAFRAAQLESGAIPGWVRVRGGGVIPSATLRESAQTAAPAMFLAGLGRVAGHAQSIRAARRAADFIIDNVFPLNRWWDYETFFSCSKKDFGMKDTGTGLECMNNLCIFWTAELMRELAEATGVKKYLEYGRRALDLLILWQQAWDAPYISINTFGGFGVMNTDGEWNDARQSMFAESLAGWYELTGEREYFERAVAALRSSFTTMLVPEHRSVAPGNMGMFIPRDEGATYENYAHMGFDKRVTGYIMFDWGSGGACAAAAGMTDRYGDIYIDAARGNAFGINLCAVRRATVSGKKISIDVDAPTGNKRDLLIKTTGLKSGLYTLDVNGKKAVEYTAAQLKKGIKIKI